MQNKGQLIVLSGPSGCGKGTLVAEMLKRGDCAVSVSATTRAPREGEIPDVHYHYLTREDFEQRIAKGELLEHAEYCGNYYGTLKSEVEQLRAAGKNVILEIEIQGAYQIKRKCPEAVLVFTIPPSIAELSRRLHKRGTETEEVIGKRIARAGEELPYAAGYDYILLNDALEDAVRDFDAILRCESMKPENNMEQIGAMTYDVKTLNVSDHLEK